jgi:hypothetical protein
MIPLPLDKGKGIKGIGFPNIGLIGIVLYHYTGVAERVGFEPTVAKGYTRSPGVPVRPLQHLSTIVSSQIIFLFYIVAERVGFEPTLRYYRRPLFESGTINHSDTSPRLIIISP